MGITAFLRPGSRGAAVAAPIRNSATVSAWTLVSRITGLLRIVAIGAVLGPTYFANTFVSTNVVPNAIYSAVAGPVLALVVVPAVVRSAARAGEAGSRMLVRRTTSLLLVGSGAVGTAMAALSPALAWTLTIGIPAPQRDRAWLLAVVLLLLVAPQVVLYTVAALGVAAQQARGRFALAAAAPALENVGMMATLAFVAVAYPAGLEVGDVPMGMVVALGAGATGAVALHAAVQAFGARRAGLSLAPGRGRRTDGPTREIADNLRRSVGVAVMPAIAFYVLIAFATSVPGGVLVIQIAWSVYAVCTSLGARAITTAVLPTLSAAVAADDRSGFAAGWRQALAYTIAVGLPLACLLVAVADPVAGLLATGKLGTGELTAALAGCIVVMAFAQLGAGVHEIGRQALFARVDLRGPRVACALQLAATTAVAAAATLLPAGPARLVGVAVAVLVADVAAAVVVVGRLRRAVRPERVLDRSRAAVAVLATVAIAPVALAVYWLTDESAGRIHDLAVLGTLVPLAFAVYVLVLALLTRRHGTDRGRPSRMAA